MPPFLKLHAIAAARGDGLRPEFQALFERLAAASRSHFGAQSDGVQAGPDPATSASEEPKANGGVPVRTLAAASAPQDD